MVEASYVSVYVADEDGNALCRLDYERDKEGYPESHIQVYGDSEALARWPGAPPRQLERPHFPTGASGRPSGVTRGPPSRCSATMKWPNWSSQPPSFGLI